MDQTLAIRFRRFRVFGIALAVAAAVLAGCGGGDDTDAADEPADAADEPTDAVDGADEPTADAPAGTADDGLDGTMAGEPADAADGPDEVTAEPVGVGGVSDERVLFGQSAVFSGPAQQLGTEMKLGIEAAFHERNDAGGVHGRLLELTALDDSYEPRRAYENTQRLVDDEGVFALIGEVGTPTSRSAYPLAHARGVPFVAPFTGAEFLRDAELANVINLRASYYQETEHMVARLTEDLGVTRVAVLYQNDSYGQAGLDGVMLALQKRDLEPVASWYYPRNSTAVKTAVLNFVEADPEAVVMIGAYEPVAEVIRLARRDIDPVFMAVSFVGSKALAEELGPEGEGVYVTQVVPFAEDGSVAVFNAYQAALGAFDAAAVPGFVSLEGYLAGRLAIKGLEMCGVELTRQCFLEALQNAGAFDIEGWYLEYGVGDNQGSDEVYLTVIGADGEYRQVEKLGGVR